MPQVSLMKFDKSNQLYHFFAAPDLAAVPRIGEKISMDNEEGIGSVFIVRDVIYSPNGKVDVRVDEISSFTEFIKRGLYDIPGL